MDTSFSQDRNARFSQTSCQENKSGEIVGMIVLDKLREKCVFQTSWKQLELRNLSIIASNQKSLLVISTDECAELTKLLK